MLLNTPIFTELAAKYRKTNVQIVLRWHIQEGNIIIPKSANPLHLQENITIFDFSLTDDEMAAVRSIDKGIRFYNRSLAEQEEKFLGILLDD